MFIPPSCFVNSLTDSVSKIMGMNKSKIQEAGIAYTTLMTEGVFDLDRLKLEELGFTEKLYLCEGPNKHEQEYYEIKTAYMFFKWSLKLAIKVLGRQTSSAEHRLIAEHMWSKLGFGLNENEDHDWEMEFGEDSVSLKNARDADAICAVIDTVDAALKASGIDRDNYSGYLIDISVQKL